MFNLSIEHRLSRDALGSPCHRGVLVLGDYVEPLACTARPWHARDYRRQWLAAADQLAAGPRARTAFVVALGRSCRVIEWWPAWREGRRVIFRNQFPDDRRIAAARIPMRRLDTRRATTVSEWIVSYAAIARWARNCRARRVTR